MNLSKEDREFLKKTCVENSSDNDVKLETILKLMHVIDERTDQGSIHGVKRQLERILFKDLNEN